MDPWRQLAPELVTDLYELTMAASYWKEGMKGEATFSLFVRAFPPHRSYFVAAGLEHFIELLTQLRFSPDSLQYLKSTDRFSSEFLDYLGEFRFTGTVRALPEGRVFFTDEPLLEVTAPIIEAQIVETLAINVLQLETLLASKAARCVHAAADRTVIDFSLRRTHGVDAGLKAARASYLAGFAGTSNVLAGKLYGIPTVGTMAHSYITSFPSEMDAFEAYARAFPGNVVLLIDTYDTLSGARKAVEIGRRLAEDGKKLRGVRLDSGDLVALSLEVRRILDDGGLRDVQILASGNLDEFKIEELIRAGGSIDVYAVGTRMGVSADAPYLDIAYKLVEYEGRPVLKLSSGKRTWVGRKQVFRKYDNQGRMLEDQLSLQGGGGAFGEPLLEEVVRDGRRVKPPEALYVIRERFRNELSALPETCKALRTPEPYRVGIGADLDALEEQTSRQIREKELK